MLRQTERHNKAENILKKYVKCERSKTRESENEEKKNDE
jgi:hypothetical protein